MKGFIANLAALGILVTSGMIMGNPIVVMAQTTEAEMEQLLKQAFQQTQYGQPLQAIDIWQKLLSLAEQQKNQEFSAFVLLQLGDGYDSIEKLQASLDSYEKALQIIKNVKSHTIFRIYRNIGQPQKAWGYRYSDEAHILSHIGQVYRKLGEPKKALEYYQQTLAILREVKDPSGEAVALSNIGLVYKDLNQTQQALDYFQQALPILQEINNNPLSVVEDFNIISAEITSIKAIGLIYQNMGQSQKAFEYYQNSVPIFQKALSSKFILRLLT